MTKNSTRTSTSDRGKKMKQTIRRINFPSFLGTSKIISATEGRKGN